ncbi:5'-nucleotidase, C-terminal domain [Arenibacter nanhaiticus]|uniref:5'-nucleotidase, C-terminal domain n=1 Tax=Arenibacter nanhaiticus TaxID=558155 RepID=A0A1M6K406_9FLAO|nr:5'-nucleotidase [Arenibacter nanhaiticus]SHJ53677.1 5'-nucleotidase, C-terminal domain [Arenibacter nanhaiticus]
MILKNQHFVIFVTTLLFTSCKHSVSKVDTIEGKIIKIDSSYASEGTIEAFVNPYRERINQVLDSTLAYAPKTISKTDGKYNSTAGNLMADIVLEEVNPIFKSRTGKDIDFVLLNHGGIRTNISKGNITTRTAYEVMPFENSVFIAELNGTAVEALVSYLIQSTKPHPIAGIQITVDENKNLKAVNIQGKPFDKDKVYFVATSDYLITGGDNMSFFKEHLSLTNVDYLLRNTLIDYFSKKDTITSVVDDRFIQEN